MLYIDVLLRIVLPSALIILLGSAIYDAFFHNILPSNLPRIRDRGKKRFSLRTKLAYFTSCADIFQEAYDTYTKRGKCCVIPTINGDVVLLPNSSLSWSASLPEKVLDPYQAFNITDSGDYVAPFVDVLLHPWQGNIVRTDLNRAIERVTALFDDELNFAFCRVFGIETDTWTEIPLWESMKQIVAQASSRYTVGAPLCRDEEYLRDTIAFAEAYVVGAGLTGLTPRILKPVLGRVFTLHNRYLEWRIQRKLKPLYDTRVAHLLNPGKDKDYVEPNDHMQKILKYAQEKSPKDFNLTSVAGRVEISNLGSYHQTGVAITNTILDLLASNAQYQTIAVLRQEMTNILASQGGVWTKAAASKMVRTDSLLRESLRLYSFGNRSMMRYVSAADGLITEDGFHLPQGTMVSIIAYPAQTDPDIFENPLTFDPYRFSKLRENAESCLKTTCTTKGSNAASGNGTQLGHKVHRATTLGIQNVDPSTLTFVSTGPTNLTFGHGKHACPGRFILDFELKMMLHHVVTHYDFELLPEYNGVRPKNSWTAEANFPPRNAKIRVRRKKTVMAC